MSDYLKLLIRNPDTNEQLWFEYPFDMDEIRKTLHIKGDGYTVIDSNSSAPVYEYDSIESIVEDYNEYLLLPDYIKRNINKIHQQDTRCCRRHRRYLQCNKRQ